MVVESSLYNAISLTKTMELFVNCVFHCLQLFICSGLDPSMIWRLSLPRLTRTEEVRSCLESLLTGLWRRTSMSRTMLSQRIKYSRDRLISAYQPPTYINITKTFILFLSYTQKALYIAQNQRIIVYCVYNALCIILHTS